MRHALHLPGLDAARPREAARWRARRVEGERGSGGEHESGRRRDTGRKAGMGTGKRVNKDGSESHNFIFNVRLTSHDQRLGAGSGRLLGELC